MRVQGSTLDSVQTGVVADSENKLKIWAEKMRNMGRERMRNMEKERF